MNIITLRKRIVDTDVVIDIKRLRQSVVKPVVIRFFMTTLSSGCYMTFFAIERIEIGAV